MNPILARVRQLVLDLGRQWLNAAVYRTVWSLPLPVVLLVALLMFLALALWG